MIIVQKVNGIEYDVSDYYIKLMMNEISNAQFETLVFERTGKYPEKS